MTTARFPAIRAALLAAAILAASVLVTGCGGDPAEKRSAIPPEVFFEGVLVTKFGDSTSRYEAHITREAQRLTVMDVEDPGAVIIRRDLGVVWNLMPAKGVFLEMPIRKENKNPLIYEPDEIIKIEKLGEEYVLGLNTVKEKLVFRNEGDEEKTITRWVARGIEWPVKAVAEDGSWEMYYDDIVFREQAPALFKIPEGYSMITARRPHWPDES